MKLFIDKDQCTISESVNGRVLEIETFEPVYIEERSSKQLLHSSADIEFGFEDEPFLTDAPKEFKL